MNERNLFLIVTFQHNSLNVLSLTIILDILLNVFLAIAVDNLADADALGDAEEEEGKEGEEVICLKNTFQRDHTFKLFFFIVVSV